MKWGYVSYHFLYCYINYCILCNKKADEKRKKKTELSCGNTTYRDKVHYAKWVSTSMEGVETVQVNEKCIDFELLQYRYGVLYLSSLGCFFNWLLMDIDKRG